MSLYQRYFKRLLDIFLSLTAIILLSPVLIMTALLVRFKLGNPIIFTQVRPGKNEVLFDMYKFRTMTDKKDESGNLFSDDIRLTSFGKKLRSTSLDELPELFNILKGDMSIVGPRPLLVQYLPLYNDEQRKRHSVKPGLTGLAQVSGRNAISWQEKFAFDTTYSENINFRTDLVILLKTIRTILLKDGITDGKSETSRPFLGNN